MLSQGGLSLNFFGMLFTQNSQCMLPYDFGISNTFSLYVAMFTNDCCLEVSMESKVEFWLSCNFSWHQYYIYIYIFCSVFSRYGIHSLPSLLMVNQTSKVQYHGPKDLQSLVQFYEKTTGNFICLQKELCRPVLQHSCSCSQNLLQTPVKDI